MDHLDVDTDPAARALALEIRDHGRERPVIVVGLDGDGKPIVSANRLAALLNPRVAIARDPKLVARHVGNGGSRRLPTPDAVDVYLPRTTRPVTVARGEWSAEAERALRGMLSVTDLLPEAIFQAWRARCSHSPEPLPPFEFGPAFAKEVARLPAHARERVGSACLKALLDRSEESVIRVGPLPTGITAIHRQRKAEVVILQSLGRDKRLKVKADSRKARSASSGA